LDSVRVLALIVTVRSVNDMSRSFFSTPGSSARTRISPSRSTTSTFGSRASALRSADTSQRNGRIQLRDMKFSNRSSNSRSMSPKRVRPVPFCSAGVTAFFTSTVTSGFLLA